MVWKSSSLVLLFYRVAEGYAGGRLLVVSAMAIAGSIRYVGQTTLVWRGECQNEGFVILVRYCCILPHVREQLPETCPLYMRVGALSINVTTMFSIFCSMFRLACGKSVGVRRVRTFLYIFTPGDETWY